MTGLDLSEEMLMIASERAYEEDARSNLWKAICYDLSEIGQYQAITCFF